MASIDNPPALLRRVQGLGGRSLRRLKPVVKAVAPTPVLRWIQRQRGLPFTPPVGKVDFGDLRPLSRIGQTGDSGRGRQIAHHYIESFMQQNVAFIRGRVLEVGSNVHARTFGGDRVTESRILDASEGTATVVGDLTDLPGAANDSYDCVIVCGTLELVFEVQRAMSSIYRVLRPGGTLLATLPGFGRISDQARAPTHWGFSAHSVERLLKEVFPPSHVEVRAHGNVLVATAFLLGLDARELTREELEFDDPGYQTFITARATKPQPFERFQMTGRWRYKNRDQFAYDGEESYVRGMAFLDGHGAIEDWGCGTAFARRFARRSQYIGINGSASRFATKLADLQTYRSETDCIFMRHVLEHNHGWRLILQNAVRSFRQRMTLILFTPFSEFEHKIGDTMGIPDLSLRRQDVVAFFDGLSYTEESLESDTQYGREHIFYIERT